jgi:threonine/homoserine/homoserine lactone efflux protein
VGGSAAQAIELGLAAFAIAFTGAMMPGPLLTVAIEHTVRRGGFSAMLLLVGHALLEAVLLLGLAFGFNKVLLLPPVTAGLSLAGGAFLVWMGAGMLVDIARGRLTLSFDASESEPSRLGPVLRGAAVSLANPYWAIWWATIGLKLASDAIRIGPLAIGTFFIGHEAADFAWYAVVVAAVSGGRRFLSDRAYRWILGVCACFLLYLGVTFAVAGLRAALQ